MTFEIEKKVYGREFIQFVEIDFESCGAVYSVDKVATPCTAGTRQIVTSSVTIDDFNVGDTIQGQFLPLPEGQITAISGSSPTYTFTYLTTNGIDFRDGSEALTNLTATGTAQKSAVAPIVIDPDGAECFNSFETCQDLINYDQQIKTFRFCEQRSPHPIGVEAIPSITGVSIAPTEIDLSGGLGVRAAVTINFKDHPFADIMFDADPYVADRGYIAFERGTFWTKIRARYPNYQFRNLRLLSGYLVDGIFDAANFETRYYVIETMNATNGRCTITAKDPLRLAMPKKALCPTPSTGLVNDNPLTVGAATVNLTPAGEGANYSSVAGENYISVNNEVMRVTNIVSDALTVVRGEYNTAPVEHAQNDTVQRAYYKNAQPNEIDKDLLENYCNIDTGIIPATAWQSEVDTFLPGLLEGIVIKPTDVNVILKELSQEAPHYLWWDERAQLIQFTALKAPPETANVIDMDGELIADSVTVKDMPNMRASTVFIHFGKFDPTKQKTETNNYQQTYIRIDSDSLAKYDNVDQVKTIFSRWISNSNKAAATQLAKLYGRRFSDTPRMINFSLDAKDSNYWAGQNAMVNHEDMTDATGAKVDTLFQLLSTKTNRDLYQYKALEFKYGPLVGDDPPDGEVVYIPTGTNQNMRTMFDTLFTASASTDATFIIESGVICGSTSTSASLMTGSWPVGATITLQISAGGYIVGRGGDGDGYLSGPAGVGGLGLELNYDLTLLNSGIIGGGGGGGGRGSITVTTNTGDAAGGGGAGSQVGSKGQWSASNSPFFAHTQADDGAIETGGAKGSAIGPGPFTLGGDGGDLGDPGGNATGGGTLTTGAAAGNAVEKNGFSFTVGSAEGDIRGTIVA